MQALKATNEMLKSGKVEQVELVQYAGPQCYPQLKERLMANAVESGGVRRDNSRPGAAGRRACPRDDGLGAVVEQVEGCWLRCDDCGARRLVERRSLASLRAERFQKTLEGGEEGFWAQWLEGARSRYDDFVQKCSAGGAGSAPGEAGGAVAGGSVAEPTGLDGGSEGGGRPDAEMEEPGESGSEHGEVLRTDVRLGLEAAKVFLGGRGGGLTVAEQEQSDALYQRERQVAGKLVADGQPRVGGLRSAPARGLQFRCSMLQREVTWRRAGDGVLRRRWETMRCRVWNAGAGQWEGGDEDDFEALHRSSWGRDDFVDGGSVVLLRPFGLGGQPESKLWARYGRVVRAVWRAAERDVVIVRLQEERARDWCAHEEVHVELSRDFRSVLSVVSRVWKDRMACLEATVRGVLGDMLGRAHVQVKPRDTGTWKQPQCGES